MTILHLRCIFTRSAYLKLAYHPPLHFTSQTAKIGSLVDIQDSEDPEGLRVFYYLVQDLKVCPLSVILFWY